VNSLGPRPIQTLTLGASSCMGLRPTRSLRNTFQKAIECLRRDLKHGDAEHDEGQAERRADLVPDPHPRRQPGSRRLRRFRRDAYGAARLHAGSITGCQRRAVSVGQVFQFPAIWRGDWAHLSQPCSSPSEGRSSVSISVGRRPVLTMMPPAC
jgi:hypothetical protein